MSQLRIVISLNRDRISGENRDFVISAIRHLARDRVISETQIEGAISNSLFIGAYEPERRELIGFVRIVSDQAIYSSVCDVFVLEGVRGNGIGTQMMKSVIEHPFVAQTICTLMAKPDLQSWYKKFGFRRVGGNVMLRPPSQ